MTWQSVKTRRKRSRPSPQRRQEVEHHDAEHLVLGGEHVAPKEIRYPRNNQKNQKKKKKKKKTKKKKKKKKTKKKPT